MAFCLGGSMDFVQQEVGLKKENPFLCGFELAVSK